MIKIITEKEEWSTLVSSSESSDFYHTFDYHLLSKKDEETPVMIKYSEGAKTILLPLLIRNINGTSYKDATSVYGYPGPVCSNVAGKFDNTTFKKELNALFLKNNIISVFSRLNPFVAHQEKVLNGLGEIETLGRLINIDLTNDLDNQRQQYQKRLRTYINKSRRNCTIINVSTQRHLLKFIELYYENMQRVKARQHYFFHKNYFLDLLGSKDFKTEILLAIHNETEEFIGGAMFIKKNQIVQYHLSGAKEETFGLNPIKLLIDEMRIRATKENYKFFNLGGGLGNKEDSLFKFKSGFSKDLRPFKIWKYIVNPNVYEDLVIEKQSRECAKIFNNCSDYFPCYRCDIYK